MTMFERAKLHTPRIHSTLVLFDTNKLQSCRICQNMAHSPTPANFTVLFMENQLQVDHLSYIPLPN